MITALMNWINGWRSDYDGWLVRARHLSDPSVLPPEIGFVDESSIAVRTPKQARELDRAALAQGGEE